MILLSKEQKTKLQKLYLEKKFSELEFEIESISNLKTRPAFLANLLGVVRLKKNYITDKDWIDSKELFLEAINKDPEDIDALCNYANTSIKLRDYTDALKKLIEKKKLGYNSKVNELLARIYSFEGEIDKAVNLYKENEKNNGLTKTSASHFLASMNYQTDFSQNKYLNYCRKINNTFRIPQNEINNLKNFLFEKNLKVGFLSPDLKQHSVYYFLMSVIRELKKNSIKVYAFNIGDPKNLDDISNFIKKDFDQWVDLHNISDFDAANQIRECKINILIDITGYFSNNRFSILKYKPAPLQISWMGYVNTMGMEEIDYILADPHLIKLEEENLYSEKVLRMPDIWNSHCGINENIKVNYAPIIKNGYITFGCFNNFSKVSMSCINTWSKILNSVDNSKLIIKGSSSDSDIGISRILKGFKNNNVNLDRVIFETYKVDRKDHLEVYHNVDVCLDTFPYPGVTTSFEAIWMGVPVLTKKGNNFVSRCGESININLNLPDFLANDENDYISKAIIISKNKEKISEVRMSLREKSLNSKLFDKKSFGKAFYDLIKDIWKKYEIQNK